MIPRLVSLAFLFMVLGCRGAPSRAAARPPSTPERPALDAPDARSANDADEPWRLTLTPLPRSGRLRVVIDTPGEVLWELPSRGTLHATEVRARHLSYELEPTAEPPCPFEVTPDRAVFCGAAVLPTPDHVDEVDVAIRLSSDASFYPAAATSYGIGRRGTVHARFVDLHHAGFVFGDVHHATFVAEAGRDHAAWVGFFSFDPRWVAAEAAGVRTAVDRWLGIERPAEDPSVGLLLTGAAQGATRIRPLRRGALVQAGPSAFWGARERVDLTRVWAQRTIGHALTVADPEARWWFDEGFAHAAAVTVLRELGILTPEEMAAEVSALLAQQAFADQDQPPRRAAVRGALLAMGLQGAGGQLGRVLRQMVAERTQGGAIAFEPEAFFAMLRRSDEETSRIEHLVDAFRQRRPVPIRASDVGPCARLVHRHVHRFELGFATNDEGDRVVAVAAGSAAERAGVTMGDELLAVDYAPGRSDVPVTLVVARDGRRRELGFLPRGPGRPAAVVTLVPGCEE